MSSNILECDICCNAFSKEYCPRLLPCSHTLCGHCIDGIIATNRKFCPSCRKEFAATSAEDLTVNRIFLDLIIQLSSKPKVSNASSSREPKASIQGREPKASIQGREPKASIQSFNEGFRKNCIKKGIKDYEETKAQVGDTIETYRDMKFLIQEADKDIDGLMEKLKGIKMSHSEMLSNIDQNIELMENALDLAFQSKIKLENLDAQLASSADFTSAGPVIDEAETVFNEIQEKIRETQDLLKCKRDADIGKEILNTKINLDNIVEEMKRRRIQNDSQVNIKPSYLRSFGSLLRPIDPREIFVVKVSNGKQMVARIDIGANRKASFSLREGTLPPRCFILKLEDFLSMPSRRGFLDVSCEGTFLGRVIIKVIDEGNLALNFLHKCAGDLGFSYVNSWCCRSVNAENCVYIVGALPAVLPGVDWQKEKEKYIYKQTSCKVGQVTAGFSTDYASQLCIITGNTGNWKKGSACFGVVEEGLDVLRKAPTYGGDLKVVDCGLMLSL
ncbi:tripartite motif-containing protein 59-like [Palaemon carinicauda]|uniref:tripartite motif-containing protein 59-like n=1 Tax=Palaemon carinicauda TaxID=392227 RepID=UPI0035B6805B